MLLVPASLNICCACAVCAEFSVTCGPWAARCLSCWMGRRRFCTGLVPRLCSAGVARRAPNTVGAAVLQIRGEQGRH